MTSDPIDYAISAMLDAVFIVDKNYDAVQQNAAILASRRYPHVVGSRGD